MASPDATLIPGMRVIASLEAHLTNESRNFGHRPGCSLWRHIVQSKYAVTAAFHGINSSPLVPSDPDAWFGKTTFDYELATLIYKKPVGIANVTLLVCRRMHLPSTCKLTLKKDVVKTVAASYHVSSMETIKQENSISNFYRSLCDQRCELDDDAWTAFRQELSHQISVSCEKLRKEKMVELPAFSLDPQPGSTRTVPPAGGSDSSENSRSPSPSSSITTASSSTPAEAQRQSSAEHLLAENERLQTLQAPHSSRNNGPESVNLVPDQRYISYAKAHAQAHGMNVIDMKSRLYTDPETFCHKATYDGVSGEGTGVTVKSAKRAAYRQLCHLKGLTVV